MSLKLGKLYFKRMSLDMYYSLYYPFGGDFNPGEPITKARKLFNVIDNKVSTPRARVIDVIANEYSQD